MSAGIPDQKVYVSVVFFVPDCKEYSPAKEPAGQSALPKNLLDKVPFSFSFAIVITKQLEIPKHPGRCPADLS